jgi:hypothetical protein
MTAPAARVGPRVSVFGARSARLYPNGYLPNFYAPPANFFLDKSPETLHILTW